MAGKIKKGTVLSIEGNKAKVAPSDNLNLVSRALYIPDYINPLDLNKGSEVAYAIFDDTTGVILSKM